MGRARPAACGDWDLGAGWPGAHEQYIHFQRFAFVRHHLKVERCKFEDSEQDGPEQSLSLLLLAFNTLLIRP